MQLIVTFANVAQPRKLIVPTATGVTPQPWVMWAIPQLTQIDPIGTLFFTDGVISLTLPSCKKRKEEVVYGTKGPMLKITGVDRREFWHGKAIDGRYNIRDAEGEIIQSTEKTPQQLAQLLFEAMGEPFANVSALPNSDRPEVNWECAPAASELEELCSRYACVPGLDISTNTAGIFVESQGSPLPNNLDVRWFHETLSGVLPNRIEACAGYVQIQSKLQLEPVLEDTNGEFQTADDVDYAPDGGWAGNVSDLEDPLQPDNPNFSEENRARAKQLWKLWRVVGFADGSLDPQIEGLLPVNDVGELLPLSDRLLARYHAEDGEVGRDAYLVGTASLGHDPDTPAANTDEGTRIPVEFTIDGETGIIKTSVPVPKTDDLEFAAADLWVVCTHMIRHPDLHQYTRYVRFLQPGGVGGVYTARRPDIIPQFVVEYGTGENHTVVQGVTDNADAVNQLLDDEIALHVARLSPQLATVVEYNGVQPISPDGAIGYVLWMLDCERRPVSKASDRNCITLGYRNIEGGDFVVYARERARQSLAVSQMADRMRRRVQDRKLNRRAVL